ncbi:MAG TPA: hypothetical protein VH682_13285 [Gemmataceae bacterium]|jgi:hypothetical protein
MSSEKTEPSTTTSGSFTSTYSYLTDEEKKMNEDYEWCLNDPEVRRQYGDRVVAAHQRRIWGAGRDHCAALDAALKQPDCPSRKSLVLVVVPPLIPLPSTPSSSAQSATTSGSSIIYRPLNEHERQINDDYEWCLHDPEVRRQYGNQVVAVHKRRIWGAGPNHSAALDAALQQPGCPPRYFLALPVVPPLVPPVADSSLSGT